LFGIKAQKGYTGPSVDTPTHEFINGQRVNMNDKFRAYGSYEESMTDWAKLISKRYAGAAAAKSGEEFGAHLKQGGYATDPAYAQKVGGTVRKVQSLMDVVPNAGAAAAAPVNAVTPPVDFYAGKSLPSAGMGAPDLGKQQAEEQGNRKTVWEGIKNIPEAFALENRQNNWILNQREEFMIRPLEEQKDWYKDPMVARELANIPQNQWGYLLNGTMSLDHFAARMQRREEAIKRQGQMDTLGAWSAPGSFAAAIMGDPTTLLYAVPGIGELAMVSRTSRLANAAATAAGWGTSAAAFAATNQNPLRQPEDVVMAGAFGVAMGGVFGGLARPIERQMIREVGRGDPNVRKTGFDKEIEQGVKNNDTTLLLGWNGNPDRDSVIIMGHNPSRTREEWIAHFNDLDARIKAGDDGLRREVTGTDASATGTKTDSSAPNPVVERGSIDVTPNWDWASSVERAFGSLMAVAKRGAGDDLNLMREAFSSFFKTSPDGKVIGLDRKEINRRIGLDHFNKEEEAFLEALTRSPLKDIDRWLQEMGLHTKDDLEVAAGAYSSRTMGRLEQDRDYLFAFRRGKAAMSAKDFLKRMAKGEFETAENARLGLADPTLKGLAERLISAIKDGNDIQLQIFKTGQKLEKVGTESPHYDYANNRIMLPDNDHGRSPATILHEIAHALTWHKLWQYSTDQLNHPDGALLYLRLDDLRKKALAKWESMNPGKDVQNEHAGWQGDEFKTTYALTGFGNGDFYAVNEFIAGIFSGNKHLLNFLAGIEHAPSQSVASRIWEVISKALGLTKADSTVLAEASRTIDEILDRPLTVTIKDPLGGVDVPMMATNFAPNPGVPMSVAQAAQNAGVPTTYGLGLGLENKLMGSKLSAAFTGVRELAAKLFGTTIGYLDHSVVGANSWDHASHLRNKWGSKLHDSEKKNFLEYAEGVSGMKRTEVYEKFHAEIWEYVHGFQNPNGQAWHPAVVAHGDTMRSLLDGEIRDHINNPSLSYGGTKRSLVSREVIDPVTGLKTMEGELALDKKYFPRKNDVTKWHAAVSSKGRQAVEDFYAGAFKSANPHIDPALADRFGKWYVKTFEAARVNKDQDLMNGLLQGRDLDALKDSLMHHGGLDSHEADMVITGMKPVDNDKGALTSNLKHRNLIDESYVSKDGLSLRDFVDTNAGRVMSGYANRQAGAIAGAHHMDIYKQGDWAKLVSDATSPGLGVDLPIGAVDEVRGHLDFAYERLMGIPVENPTKMGKVMEMFRNFNVIRLMGGAVMNQIAEFGQTLGSLGLGTVARAIPEYSKIMAGIKAGTATDEIKFFKDLFDGVGATLGERMDFGATDDWVKLRGQNDAFSKSLDWLDNGLRKGASGLLKYSGMTPLTNLQRKVHAVGMVNKIMDLARTGGEDALFSENRLAWMGMSKQDYSDLKAALVKHEKADKATMWEKMQEKDPELYAKLMTAVHRESKRVVQENDLASMVPIMGKGIGQTMFQFQNFAFQAWNKAMLHGYHQRDSVAFLQLGLTSMLGSLVYAARTQIQSIGLSEDQREKFMEDRMALQKILVGGGVMRTAQASVLPQIAGTFLPSQWLDGTKTTSDVTSIASIPALQTVKAVGSLIKDPLHAATSDEYQIASRDVKQWSRLIPFNNYMGQSLIGNMLGKELPSSNNEAQ
jgi:hypothetical protein